MVPLKFLFIFLKKKLGYVRITDLGIAKAIKPENSEETSGTPGYMAPEVMCRQNHGIAVDYFALGVIVFEFMLGYVPFFFLLSFCFFFYKKRDPISEDQDKKSERQSLLNRSKLKKANCLMAGP